MNKANDPHAMSPSWQAAKIIAQSLSNGQSISALPDACRPHTRLAGYAAQALLPQASGLTVAGWKIGATSLVGQAHIGVSGPLGGRLFGQHIHREGDTVPLWGNRMKVAEPEFAFVFAHELLPRASPCTVDEVLAAVGELRPAIELPSSRFEDFVTAGEAQLIADNACAGRFVFGNPAPDEWRRIDLAAHAVRGTIERAGQVVLERAGSGAAVLGDPRVALTWLVNELLPMGLSIAAGQIVSTGTCMAPLPIEGGDRVHVDFGVLGSTWLACGTAQPG